MADSDLSLLFRLKADNTQAKAAMADTRAAIGQLRQSFGPQLTQTVTVANQTFSNLDGTLQNFVAQRLPLVGGALVQVTDKLRGFTRDSAKSQKALSNLAGSIQSIATQSGKSAPQIAGFLTKFVQIEGQAKRNDAAFKFFGGSIDLIGNKTAKFLPELEEAGSALAGVAEEGGTAASAIAGMAGPIGIAVLALAALAAGALLAGKQLFDATKHAADFEGKMFDLAQQTGIAVETLSAFEVVAKTTGGDLGQITQALVAFQRKLDDAQDPLSKTAELFRKFKISTSDTETSLRSAFQALAAMPEGFAQTNAAAELFGARGGKQVLAMLKESNGDIDGTIARLREMGILISDDMARSADKFNDELELLNFQWRALSAAAVQDLIPAMTEIVRETGKMITALRPLIALVSPIAKVIIEPTILALKSLSLTLAIVTRDYKALAEAAKEAGEEQQINPINVPGTSPVPLPSAPTERQAASEAVNQADAVLGEIKRRVAAGNQILDEMFQRGRRDRDQQAEEIIAGNKKVLEADQARIDALLKQKEQEIRALDEAQRNRGEIVRRDTEDYRAITSEIVKLQQERFNKENEFDVQARAIRAKVAKENADARRNQIANDTDLFANELDRQIKTIEGQIKRQEVAEETGLEIIEKLEQAKIDARIAGREKQKELGFLTVQDQVDLNNDLKKLEQERGTLADDQQNRRLQRERDAGERQRDILIANIDALLQIQQVRGQRLIDAQSALAEARVITEEQAAKKILDINLGLIDAQIEATKTKLAATASIAGINERTRAQADLNNQIKVLTEERVSIEAAGERLIDEGRQRDLQNYRDYANEIEDISERVNQTLRDAAQEAIRLMRIHFASQRDIVRARTQLDLDEENTQHQTAQRRLDELQRENRESRKTEQEKLEFEQEINRLREAEAERHRLAVQGIQDAGARDEKNASPLGRLGLDTENLKELASVIESQLVPLGETLTRTFLQVADAIGQTVANWVLLGETGPAVMRKILAQALASIAAEATVNAIKEAALGFATLFFNPAESAAHFTAAALWGSIAGVSAIAGRGVAGDLFKSKGAGAGGSATAGQNGAGQLNPLTLERTTHQQPQRVVVTVNVKQDPHSIVDVFAKDFQSGGKTREVVINDGMFGG